MSRDVARKRIYVTGSETASVFEDPWEKSNPTRGADYRAGGIRVTVNASMKERDVLHEKQRVNRGSRVSRISARVYLVTQGKPAVPKVTKRC
jgi:hypothetical protein